MRIELGYPDREAERLLLGGDRDQRLALENMKRCLAPEDVLALQEQVDRVTVSDAFLNYLQDLLDFTRTGRHFHMGLSPRAGLALMHAARSWSLYQRAGLCAARRSSGRFDQRRRASPPIPG